MFNFSYTKDINFDHSIFHYITIESDKFKISAVCHKLTDNNKHLLNKCVFDEPEIEIKLNSDNGPESETKLILKNNTLFVSNYCDQNEMSFELNLTNDENKSLLVAIQSWIDLANIEIEHNKNI